MTTTIKHNKYDNAGNVIGTFDVEVKPSNETETDIYITDEFLRNTAKQMSKNSTSGSNYSSYEKRCGTSQAMAKRYALNGWNVKNARKSLTLPSPAWMTRKSISHCN